MSLRSEASVTTWLAGLKARPSEAAEPLWRRYVERLVRRARRKLGGCPRRIGDEEDIAVSAFDGFLRGVAAGRFPQLEDRNDLWQVLVMLTERKAITFRRRALAEKRGSGQVRGESVFAGAGEGNFLEAGLDQEPDRALTPAFAAEMTERLRLLFGSLTDDRQRQLALGKLQGHTNQELAALHGISVRTVERKLELIRAKWQGALP